MKSSFHYCAVDYYLILYKNRIREREKHRKSSERTPPEKKNETMKLEQQQNKTTNRPFLSFFLFSRFYTPNIVSDNKKEEEKRKASREGAEEEGQTRLCAKTISPLSPSLSSPPRSFSLPLVSLSRLSLFFSLQPQDLYFLSTSPSVRSVITCSVGFPPSHCALR